MKYCLYCKTKLVKLNTHPSWKGCPQCEPNLFKQIQAPTGVDKRGQPSKPGSVKKPGGDR